MPVKIPSSLPAVEILKAENIFVMDDLRASTQDIRPLKLLILNLMPLKIVTETDLLRLISNTPLQIELDFMSVSGHISRNTPLEHIDTFYKDFDEIRGQNYDGMIITGAPVENYSSRRSITGTSWSRFSTGRTNTSPLLSIFVGLLWPGCTIFTESLNTRWIKNFSEYSPIINTTSEILFSEDSTTCFTFLTVDIPRYAEPISKRINP